MIQVAARVLDRDFRRNLRQPQTGEFLILRSHKLGLVAVWAIVLAALLQNAAVAQEQPPAAGSAQTPNTQPGSEPNEKQPASESGRRIKRGGKVILATIIQSRSTNTRGYKVEIHDDGSATVKIDASRPALNAEPAQAEDLPAASIDVKVLRRLLNEIGDVSKIPTGGCAKSVSFGTRTQISYGDKTSGDLQCIRQQDSDADPSLLKTSQELGKLVETILRQVKAR
jgi:pyruvate/2-oxoglutarate dehydrogenase complex dihydrolipoamide acyltransferase (E2) component